MLIEDQRHATGLAESAIGEADSFGFDILGRGALVRIGTHELKLL
jgi:hypothetical protein